tara:strand:+ start:48345 stop:49163 length:819 start_codon:yes stop_codon:yes gene_type:complete
MGLAPLNEGAWIETDNHLQQYHQHKLQQRIAGGDKVYQTLPESEPAQRELSAALRHYLCSQQPENYRIDGDKLVCSTANFRTPVSSEEALWNCSLWVADDLVIMQADGDDYRLTAASLCSPSHWRLTDKFAHKLSEIHDPIPGFHDELTPRIKRFMGHLRAQHPVIRFNWSLQASEALQQDPEEEPDVTEATALFYRTERQSLLRLPQTGAIVFTIRVYIHPLESLLLHDGALEALFKAIDDAPDRLYEYKGFDELEPALARYRLEVVNRAI